MKAVITHGRWASPPSSPTMRGSAVLTIFWSSEASWRAPKRCWPLGYMRTVETADSALTEPARLARKSRRRRRRGSEEGAWIRRLGRRELAGAFRNGRCRGWKRCSHCGQSRNKWTTSPLVAAMAAAIQTPSGGTDRFDERRKRRIADQILFVPLAARRQRDHAIEQRAPSLEAPKVCRLVWGFSCQVVIFGFLAILCSERECRSSSRRLRSGSRSARKGSRDRNA